MTWGNVKVTQSQLTSWGLHPPSIDTLHPNILTSVLLLVPGRADPVSGSSSGRCWSAIF